MRPDMNDMQVVKEVRERLAKDPQYRDLVLYVDAMKAKMVESAATINDFNSTVSELFRRNCDEFKRLMGVLTDVTKAAKEKAQERDKMLAMLIAGKIDHLLPAEDEKADVETDEGFLGLVNKVAEAGKKDPLDAMRRCANAAKKLAEAIERRKSKLTKMGDASGRSDGEIASTMVLEQRIKVAVDVLTKRLYKLRGIYIGLQATVNRRMKLADRAWPKIEGGN